MKQMLKEMKWNSFVSLLKFFIGLGGMGTAALLYQRKPLMQLLGLLPMEEEIKKDEVLIISFIGAAMLLFVLWLLIRVVSGSLQKSAKEFLSQLDDRGREELVRDYQNAWRGSRTIRIGRLYTYVLDDGTSIYRNKDIIWVYPWHERTRYAKNCYLAVYFLKTGEPQHVGVSGKATPRILEYYDKNFPHMVVGCSDEASYYFKNDMEQFLQLRYYKEENPKGQGR